MRRAPETDAYYQYAEVLRSGESSDYSQRKTLRKKDRIMKATWNNKVIAESDETVYIEGNQYFPLESVKAEFLVKTDLTTECHWKGTANYYSLVDGDTKAENAAWYYANPKEGSVEKVKHDFKDYVAFYPNIVEVKA